MCILVEEVHCLYSYIDSFKRNYSDYYPTTLLLSLPIDSEPEVLPGFCQEAQLLCLMSPPLGFFLYSGIYVSVAPLLCENT